MRRIAAATVMILGCMAALGADPQPKVPSEGERLAAAQAAVRQLVADLGFAQSDAAEARDYRRVHFYEDGSGYCVYRIDADDFNDPFNPDRALYVPDPTAPAKKYIVKYATDPRFNGASIRSVLIDGSGPEVTYGPTGSTLMWDGTRPVAGTGGSILLVGGTRGYQVTIAPGSGAVSVAPWRGGARDKRAESMRGRVGALLQMLRDQIERYNAQNPGTPLDRATPLENFWDPLVKGEYIPIEPKNPLQNDASKVAAHPGPGIGWVWAANDPGDSRAMRLYAVDVDGSLLDVPAARAVAADDDAVVADTPRAKLAACKGTVLNVRAAVSEYFVSSAAKNERGSFPTLAQLTAKRTVLDRPIPPNPFNGDARVAPANKLQAKSRTIVGSGEGWAYYDGSEGGQAVFYANTGTANENKY